jgi:hypothetical protein
MSEENKKVLSSMKTIILNLDGEEIIYEIEASDVIIKQDDTTSVCTIEQMEGILNTLINFLTKSQKIEFIAGSNQL